MVYVATVLCYMVEIVKAEASGSAASYLGKSGWINLERFPLNAAASPTTPTPSHQLHLPVAGVGLAFRSAWATVHHICFEYR